MKVICFGVSIVTLLTSIPSYAMEEFEGGAWGTANPRIPPYFVEGLKNIPPSVAYRSGNEKKEMHLKLVKSQKLYLGSLPSYHSPILEELTADQVKKLCKEASKAPNLTELDAANIDLNRAGACLKLHQNEKAAAYFQLALGREKPDGNFEITGDDRVRTYYCAAKAHKKLEQYNKARDFCLYALKIQEQQTDPHIPEKLGRTKIFSRLEGVFKKFAKKVGDFEACKYVLEVKTEDGCVVVGGRDRVKIYRFLANKLTSEKQNSEAAIYYHKALDAKKGYTYLLRGVERLETMAGLVGTFQEPPRSKESVGILARLASMLHELKRDKDAVPYYFKAINAVCEKGYFLLEGTKRGDTLYELVSALKLLGRAGDAKEVLKEEVANSSRLNLKKLKEVMEEENVSIDIAEQDLDLLRENEVLRGCLQDIEWAKSDTIILSPNEIAKRYEIIGNVLHNKAVREVRWPSQASYEAYTLASYTKSKAGIHPVYSDYDQKRIHKKMEETQKSMNVPIHIQMPTIRKRKQPLPCDRDTKKDEKSIPMESKREESVANLFCRIERSLTAAGDLKIALKNCNELIEKKNLMSEKDFGSALELKLTVLQRLEKVSQGEVKKKMREEVADLEKLIRERQQGLQSSRMEIGFLLDEPNEKPPLKKPRLPSEEASNS